MTDDVAAHVLRDNYEQNVLLGNARVQAHSMLVGAQALHPRPRAARRPRPRAGVPAAGQRDRRAARGRPRAHVAGVLRARGLLEDDAGRGPARLRAARRGLVRPARCAATSRRSWCELHGDRLDDHPLRREIVTTTVVNDLVNRGGITFSFRASEETGATPVEIARAYSVVREVFGLETYWAPDRGARHPRPDRRPDRPLPRGPSAARPGDALAAPGPPVRRRRARRDRALRAGRGPDPARAQLPARRRARAARTPAGWTSRGSARRPTSLATPPRCSTRSRCSRSWRSPPRRARLAETVGQIYFALSERFDVDRMLTRITMLPRDDRWSALARMALRYDLYAALAALTRSVQAAAPEETDPDVRIAAWEAAERRGPRSGAGDAHRDRARRDLRPRDAVGGAADGAHAGAHRRCCLTPSLPSWRVSRPRGAARRSGGPWPGCRRSPSCTSDVGGSGRGRASRSPRPRSGAPRRCARPAGGGARRGRRRPPERAASARGVSSPAVVASGVASVSGPRGRAYGCRRGLGRPADERVVEVLAQGHGPPAARQRPRAAWPRPRASRRSVVGAGEQVVLPRPHGQLGVADQVLARCLGVPAGPGVAQLQRCVPRDRDRQQETVHPLVRHRVYMLTRS